MDNNNNIQCILGDCLESMKDIPDYSIDLILTDPPYGTTKAEWDIAPDFSQVWEHWKRIIKPDGAIVVFSQLPFAVDIINANRKWFRYEWIWEKPKAVGFLNSHRMPMRAHENVLVFYKSLPIYNEQRRHGFENYSKKHTNQSQGIYGETKDGISSSFDGTRHAIDILKFNNTNCSKFHSTAKPVPLLEYFIKTYTNKDETVLDCFMGSGSTGVACKLLNRKFIGIESNEEFYNKALDRLFNNFDVL